MFAQEELLHTIFKWPVETQGITGYGLTHGSLSKALKGSHVYVIKRPRRPLHAHIQSSITASAPHFDSDSSNTRRKNWQYSDRSKDAQIMTDSATNVRFFFFHLLQQISHFSLSVSHCIFFFEKLIAATTDKSLFTISISAIYLQVLWVPTFMYWTRLDVCDTVLRVFLTTHTYVTSRSSVPWR